MLRRVNVTYDKRNCFICIRSSFVERLQRICIRVLPENAVLGSALLG